MVDIAVLLSVDDAMVTGTAVLRPGVDRTLRVGRRGRWGENERGRQ